MAILMSQLHGLGQAEIVAAVIGPVAVAGADIYRTREESKFSRAELKQRGKEFAVTSAIQRDQLKGAEFLRIMQQRKAAQRYAMRGAWWERNLPLIVGGSLLAILAIAAAQTRRKRA